VCAGLFDVCPGDIWLVSWRYLMGVQEILDPFPEIILFVSWRYLIGVLEIFDRCPGDI